MIVHGKPTGARRKPKTGGGVKKAPDIQRIARGMRGKGNDLRHWVSSGTIGIVKDDGTFIVTGDEARAAVYADTEGCIVDVRLEPSGIPLSCRWHGMASGSWGNILVPARPGDEVLVIIPDGDLNHPGRVALPFGGNASAPTQADWNHDRVLIRCTDVPLDIEAPAVRITSPNLQLNGRPVANSTDPI